MKFDEARKQELLKTFYNAEEGTVLGRTKDSWIKVLAFYAVYYTFLIILFVSSVKILGSDIATGEGKQPVVRTRLDQPGLAVNPFSDSSLIHCKGSKSVPEYVFTEKCAAAYAEAMDKWLSGLHRESSRVCRGTVDAGTELFHTGKLSQSACALENMQYVSKELVLKSIENKMPLVTLDLNKIIKWKPVNLRTEKNHLTVATDGPNNLVKNAVYFDCFEVVPSDTNQRVEDSMFNLTFLGEPYLHPNYFPFLGYARDEGNTVYNKPFAVLQVGFEQAINATKVEAPGTKRMMGTFKCTALADNLDRVDEYGLKLDSSYVFSIGYEI